MPKDGNLTESLKKYGENLHSRECEKGYQNAKEMGIDRVTQRMVVLEMISKKGYWNGQIQDYADLYKISVDDAHGELIFFYKWCRRDENDDIPIIADEDISLGNPKASCNVSFFRGNAGSVMMQVRNIAGIAVENHGIFPEMHESEVDFAMPLPDHFTIGWHKKDGIEAIELVGGGESTFIPCLGSQLDDMCLIMCKGVPNCSA